MKKHTNQGASIAQYSIIIALIALVLVPVFFIFGKTIVESFENFNTNLKSTPPSGSGNPVINNAILNGTVQAGQLNGKPDNPKLLCHQSKCSIDYGEFVLNGLPENYGDFVQSSGNSGGTDMLATMFEQLAKISKENGDFKGASEYKLLANLGHLVGDFQGGIETISQKALNESSEQTEYIFSSEIDNPALYNVLESYPGLDDVVTNLKKSDTVLNATLMTRPDYAKHLKTSGTPGTEMLNVYEKIMNNDKSTSTMKSVTKELYANLCELAFNAQAATASSYDPQGSSDPSQNVIKKYDPFTGKELTDYTYPIPTFTSDNRSAVVTAFIKDTISAPKTSHGTDLNSSLVCATGKNSDTGGRCK